MCNKLSFRLASEGYERERRNLSASWSGSVADIVFRLVNKKAALSGGGLGFLG
jgi:hypothetical protein